MLRVFDRRLAVPLWATGCVAVALTVSPPATPFVVTILGIASIAFSMQSWLHSEATCPCPSRS